MKPTEATPWLHIRSQCTYHQEAEIRGTRAGLIALCDAVAVAIHEGSGEGSVFASDGEGYRVTVTRASGVRGIGEPTYLDELARELARMEMNFLVRHSKLLRKQQEEALVALRWCRANGNPHRDSDVSSAEDAKRLSPEGVAARAEGIAP